MNKEKFERIVRFRMPFDKRTDNPQTNYGICSFGIVFILKGKKGAVQVFMNTEFFLPKTINEYLNSNNHYWKNLLKDTNGKDKFPFGCWDVGFHSKKKPSYMEKSDKSKCDILDCGYCYYDGSSLRGNKDKLPELFFEKGEEAIWKYLEKYYAEQFPEENKK